MSSKWNYAIVTIAMATWCWQAHAQEVYISRPYVSQYIPDDDGGPGTTVRIMSAGLRRSNLDGSITTITDSFADPSGPGATAISPDGSVLYLRSTTNNNGNRTTRLYRRTPEQTTVNLGIIENTSYSIWSFPGELSISVGKDGYAYVGTSLEVEYVYDEITMKTTTEIRRSPRILRINTQTGSSTSLVDDFSGFSGPGSIAVDSEGRLYYIKNSSNPSTGSFRAHLYRRDPNGSRHNLGLVQSGAGSFWSTPGELSITADRYGQVYVTTRMVVEYVTDPDSKTTQTIVTEPGRILRIDGQTGTQSTVMSGSPGLTAPAAIALDSRGTLYYLLHTYTASTHTAELVAREPTGTSRTLGTAFLVSRSSSPWWSPGSLSIAVVQDTDGDGLLDTWEAAGVDTNGDNVVDLAIHESPYGTTPDRPDLIVEVDRMIASPPTSAFASPVKAAFANAPVSGGNGIRIHIVESDTGINPVRLPSGFATRAGTGNDYAEIVGAFLGTQAERNAANWPNTKLARLRTTRYCLMARGVDADQSLLGQAELYGNDFVLYTENIFPPTGNSLAGAFMHELGHTLGLGHGGICGDGTPDHENFKPNYFGVMNYMWAIPHADVPGQSSAWRLDYNREDLPSLDENNLSETSPFTPQRANPGIMYFNPTRWGVFDFLVGNDRRVVSEQLPAPGGINWDGDSDPNETGVRADINWVPRDGAPGSRLSVLRSRNDWTRLRIAPEEGGKFAEGVHDAGGQFEEISVESLQAWTDSLSVGCNAVDVAMPFGQLDIDDVLTFLAAFSAESSLADIASPVGLFDIDDILLFLSLFLDGCPS